MDPFDIVTGFLDQVSDVDDLMNGVDIVTSFIDAIKERLQDELIDNLVVKDIVRHGKGSYDEDFVKSIIQMIKEIVKNPNQDSEMLINQSLFHPLGVHAQTSIAPNESLALLSSSSLFLPSLSPTKPTGARNNITEVDNYRIRRLIGSGSCADVYLAAPKTLGNTSKKNIRVALKCIKKGEDRLDNELDAIQSIDSPFVVKLLSYGDLKIGEYSYYIAIEYCHFGALSGFLKPEINEHLRSIWIYQLIQGIKAIHDNGYIHRDLKPSNLLIDRQGVLKICDFGLVRNLNSKVSRTKDNTLIGTLAYMSPEQLKEEPATKQSDIWSFGAILYEMFMGRPLYSSQKQIEIISQRTNDRHEINFEGIPDEIAKVIKCCLQTQLTSRYKTIDECWGDLEPYINRVLISSIEAKQRFLWERLRSNVNDIIIFSERRSKSISNKNSINEASMFLKEWDAALLNRDFVPLEMIGDLIIHLQEHIVEKELLRVERDGIQVQSVEEISREVDMLLTKQLNQQVAHSLTGLEDLLNKMKMIKREFECQRDDANARWHALCEKVEEITRYLEEYVVRSIEQQLKRSEYWNGTWVGTVGLEAPESHELREQRALKVSCVMTPYNIMHVYEYKPQGLLSAFRSPEKREFIERRLRHSIHAEELDRFTLSFCPPGQLLDVNQQLQRTFTRGFWIMTTPVTRRLWRQVMGTDPSSDVDFNTPVTNISWYEALSFANALSLLDRRSPYYQLTPIKNGQYEVRCDSKVDGYRLPSIHEWRYAAKAGEDHIFAGSNDIDLVGWCAANSGKKIQSVKQKKPNAWSIYDMSGNVSEWVADPDTDQPIARGKHFDSTEGFSYLLNYPNRYALGGNFISNEQLCATMKSSQYKAFNSESYIGLRLVISPNLNL